MPRGIDNYDRQLILNLYTGDGDNVITSSCKGLKEKAVMSKIETSEINLHGLPHEESSDLGKALKLLTSKSRIYIIGHGQWRYSQVGNWKGGTLASYISKHWKKEEFVSTISIVSCSVARGPNCNLNKLHSHKILTQNSAYSFASEFHKDLKESYNLVTTVYARMYDVTVFASEKVGEVNNVVAKDDVGRKGTKWDNGGLDELKREDSKVVYYWKNNEQKMKFVKYRTYSIVMDYNNEKGMYEKWKHN